MLRSPLVAVFAGLALAEFALLVTTIWLHRTLSHRAMTVSPGLTRVFRVLTWITTGIRPRQWVAVHRKHHAFTDVEGDPHSPRLEGFSEGPALQRRPLPTGGAQARRGGPLCP